MATTRTEDDYKRPKLFMPFDFVRYKVKQLEKESHYLKGVIPSSDDIKAIDDTIETIKESKVLTKEQLNKIKEIAAKKGGFLSIENRKFLYKKILNVNEDKYNKYYDTIWINKQNNQLYSKKEYLYQIFTGSEIDTIDKDVNRSSLNSIFPSSSYENLNLSLKHILTIVLNTLTSFNFNELNYFQGYHDITLLFLLLFINSPQTVALVQRFSETHIKENLLIPDKSGVFGYTFANCLELFNTIVKAIDEKIYKDIEEYSCGQASFIFPWIVGLFTHNLSDVMLQMRLMDYFITSHPIAVFVLTAVITIDEIKKLKMKHMASNLGNSLMSLFGSKNRTEQLDQAQFFIHFQQLDMNKIDYDKYITECERKMKEIDFVSLIQTFKEKKYMEYYPMMKKVPFAEDLIEYEKNQKSNFMLTEKIILGLCVSFGTAYIAITFVKKKISFYYTK